MSHFDDFAADLEAMEAEAPTMTDAEKLNAIETIFRNDAAYEYEGLGWNATETVALLVGVIDPGQTWRGPGMGAVERWEP